MKHWDIRWTNIQHRGAISAFNLKLQAVDVLCSSQYKVPWARPGKICVAIQHLYEYHSCSAYTLVLSYDSKIEAALCSLE